MLALVSLLLINNTYLSYFAAGICFYIGIAGVLLTIVGVKRTNMKEDITIHVEKRSVIGMNHTKKNRLALYIAIPVIILLILLRFGLYFIRSDGFSGLSMLLPILLLCFVLFALCTCGFFAAWVYQDCKRRGDDPVLWALVVFIATPFIGVVDLFFCDVQK